MGRRIGLVGCVKEKRSVSSRAADLYTSTLFIGRRRYVERSCDEWWILSAEHGLVDPDQVLAPYDLALKKASRPDRRRWSERVLHAIDDQIILHPGDVVEIHAGAEYREFGLELGLQRSGCVIEIPTLGMPIGKQLQFYSRQSLR
jgi:hypothetical protein